MLVQGGLRGPWPTVIKLEDAFLALVLFTVLVGFVAGYLSGEFGIGGGLLTTPAIVMALGYPESIAIGTPLVVMIPSVLSASVNYYRRNYVNFRLVVPLSVSGFAGVLLGAATTAVVRPEMVILATSVVIFGVGLRFTLRPTTQQGTGHVAETGDGAALWLLWPVGLAVGYFSGFLGLGGGSLLIPALIGIFKTRVKEALGTSLVVIAVFAVPGSIVHYSLAHVDLRLAFLLAIGVIPGAYVGSWVAVRLSERLLMRLFGAALAVLAVALAIFEVGWRP